jgi:putative DNA-invertase from lambdoid prophage Rac
VSGGKRLARRPKGAELLKTLRSGDHVIATQLDRIFRSAVDALNVAADLLDRGCHLRLLDIGGEVTGTGLAKLVFNVLAAVAEMERERIGERVRSVKQHLRASGYFTGGHTACGFIVTDEGKLVPQQDWQDCLHAMRKMREGGMPCCQRQLGHALVPTEILVQVHQSRSRLPPSTPSDGEDL